MRKGVDTRRKVEIELRSWLRGHHGAIGYAEALGLGASPGMVKSKIDRGEWARMHRAVYRDTAIPTGPYQDLRGGCVATGGLGVVSHGSAAWVWALLTRAPAIPVLTIPDTTWRGGGHCGLTIHRAKDLDLATAVHKNALLVTNPLRTLVDLAGSVLPGELTEAVDNALARRLITVAGLEAEIERLSRRGRNGVGVLRRHLDERGFTNAPPPSVLEAHMRRLVRKLDLPLPGVEVAAGDDGEYRLDIAWVAILFTVEVDGYRWHSAPEHKERDETRRARLRDAGWTVRVYGWHEVIHEPARVGREITATYRRLSQPA